MAISKRRFNNFLYILVTLFLVLVAKVQSSDDVTRVKRRMVAMCPPGFQKIRTECYHISAYPLTWLDAHFECKNKNGKLAEPSRIQDAAIRKFLLNRYARERDEIFFGGMFDHHAQEWSWGGSGQKFNYSSFIGLKTYLKRRTLNYTCTVYNPNRKFRWTPRDCTENHRFMCEHKMPKVSEKNKDKVYQRWNVTYPNQFANEVVMEVREDDRRNNSGRVKVVSASGEEEFYMKRTPHPPHPRRNARLPVFARPTYNPPNPQTKSSNDILNDAGNSVENNEIIKPTKNLKKDRTRSKFDRDIAKQRRLEVSKKRAAKKEERQRKLREKEELRKQKEQANESKNLEIQKAREESERKRLQEERVREEEERRRLEDAARREADERQRLEDAMRREERERQQLEDERRLQNEEDPKRQKRLGMGLVGVDFIPEVITEDSIAIEQRKIEKQKEVEELEKQIREKYDREQEAELALQKMEQEKHLKELEEKELARRAEEQKHREEREKERQELVRQAEEDTKRIELEKQLYEERRKEEEENQKRLEIEKLERIEQEKREKERREKEEREREEEENRRKAELQKKVDAEKDGVIEEEIRKKEKLEKKKELSKRIAKLSPEAQRKFFEMKLKKAKAKLLQKANEVTRDDKK